MRSSSSTEESALAELSPQVQGWVAAQGWPALRDIQTQAIGAIRRRGPDVILMAPTAGGKTEAALLPIASTFGTDAMEGVAILVISPLKALINDQSERLETLGEAVGSTKQGWHGDIGGRKRSALRRQNVLLLITPESLEALFVLRAPSLRAALALGGRSVVSLSASGVTKSVHEAFTCCGASRCASDGCAWILGGIPVRPFRKVRWEADFTHL